MGGEPENNFPDTFDNPDFEADALANVLNTSQVTTLSVSASSRTPGAMFYDGNNGHDIITSGKGNDTIDDLRRNEDTIFGPFSDSDEEALPTLASQQPGSKG